MTEESQGRSTIQLHAVSSFSIQPVVVVVVAVVMETDARRILPAGASRQPLGGGAGCASSVIKDAIRRHESSFSTRKLLTKLGDTRQAEDRQTPKRTDYVLRRRRRRRGKYVFIPVMMIILLAFNDDLRFPTFAFHTISIKVSAFFRFDDDVLKYFYVVYLNSFFFLNSSRFSTISRRKNYRLVFIYICDLHEYYKNTLHVVLHVYILFVLSRDPQNSNSSCQSELRLAYDYTKRY